MSGHGTVMTGTSAQGNAQVYVSSSDSQSYAVGIANGVLNSSGGSLVAGDVVNLAWDAALNSGQGGIKITSKGARGRGTVNGTSTKVQSTTTVGITDLPTTNITISTTYPSSGNSGFSSQTVYFGNVEGKASHLSTAS
jgi:hypothetical protein